MQIIIISLLYLGGAIIAFFKDLLFASYFGTSGFADVMNLSFFIPDTIGGNLVGAAIGVAGVSVYTIFQEERLKGYFPYIFRKTCWVMVWMTGAIVCILMIFSANIFNWIAGGMDSELKTVGSSLLQLMSPIALLYPLVMVGGAFLQSRRQFYTVAASPILFNAVFLLSILFCSYFRIEMEYGIFIVSFGTVIGVLFMLLMIWRKAISIVKAELVGEIQYLEGSQDEIKHHMRRIGKIFFMYLGILLCTQSIYLLERSLAANMGPGIVAGLNYAFRLCQFPLWIFVTAVNMVILPNLSTFISNGEVKKIKQVLSKGICLTLGITFVVSLFLYYGGETFISLLFKRGAFDQGSLMITSSILSGYCLSIVGQGIVATCHRYFLASADMLWPFIIQGFASVLQVYFMMWFSRTMGSSGIGYAAAIGSTVNAVLVSWVLWKKISNLEKENDNEALSNHYTSV